MPESMKDLKNRLENRGQDSEEEIQRRLKTAANEITLNNQFDHIIHSKSKDEDYGALLKIYKKHSKFLYEFANTLWIAFFIYNSSLYKGSKIDIFSFT